MSTASLKEQIQQHCHSQISERIETALQAISSAEASSQDDTKSSAGDKYETGREMMQQELNRHQNLLLDARKMLQTLENLSTMSAASTTDKVVAGSLVECDEALFYLAVGLGKINVKDQEILVISPTAPVGQLLLGKKVGDHITFNSQTYRIIQLS